jgi:hypothetical protein
MKRMIAFGCSFTKYGWPTVADIVGASFDEYYNFGQGGACNTYIMNQMVERLDNIPLYPESDFILIGTTGVMRHSFLKSNDTWMTTGDIYPIINPGHPKDIHWFAKNLFNGTQAVYETYMALKNIKMFLEYKGIKHFILPAIDNKIFLEMPELFSEKGYKMLEEICSWQQIPTIEETAKQFKSYNFKDGNIDGHPTIDAAMTYALDHLPHLINERSMELYNESKEKFVYESNEQQSFIYNTTIATKYRKN